MEGKTHLAGGLCAAMLLGAPSSGVILAAAGSLIPDIDCPDSFCGRYLRHISLPLEHRSFTHSLVFAAASLMLNKWFALGVVTHIILDMMTYGGVRLLWPRSRRYRLLPKTMRSARGRMESVLLLILLGITVTIAVSHAKLGLSEILYHIERLRAKG